MRHPGTGSVLITLALSLMSCGGAPADGGSHAAAGTSRAASHTELAAATYVGLEEAAGPVTLRDGEWTGEPFAEGGAARPRVTLVDDFYLSGDLDGDGAAEAVGLLAGSMGGTGVNLYVAVIGRRHGEPTNLATALVGDRVQIRSAAIEDGRIVLGVLRAGSQDAMCCPGELATLAWELAPGGDLVQTGSGVSSGRLTAAAIGTHEWVLAGWDRTEPAPAEPEITLTYADGRLAGTSGCNRYFTEVREGVSPGDIDLGPIGATMMACPDSVMRIERRFLTQLAGARKFGFQVGKLMLISEEGGEWKTLLFESRDSVTGR